MLGIVPGVIKKEVSTMEKVKENAVRDFVEMISHSWTWDRMTDEEKRNFHVCVNNLPVNAITGTYNNRWHIINAIYTAYLAGLGYLGGADWREPEKKEETEDFHAIRREYLRKITNPHPFIGHPHY